MSEQSPRCSGSTRRKYLDLLRGGREIALTEVLFQVGLIQVGLLGSVWWGWGRKPWAGDTAQGTEAGADMLRLENGVHVTSGTGAGVCGAREREVPEGLNGQAGTLGSQVPGWHIWTLLRRQQRVITGFKAGG